MDHINFESWGLTYQLMLWMLPLHVLVYPLALWQRRYHLPCVIVYLYPYVVSVVVMLGFMTNLIVSRIIPDNLVGYAYGLLLVRHVPLMLLSNLCIFFAFGGGRFFSLKSPRS